MSHTENDRHLHLVGIGEYEGVVRPVPTGIKAKRIHVAVWFTTHNTALSFRERPSRMEQVECLGKYVVVNETRVDGEQAHKENDVSAATALVSVKFEGNK